MKNKILVPGIFVLAVIGTILISGCTQPEGEGLGGAPSFTLQQVGQQIPTADVVGEDISDIPRYSGSVRIHHGPIPGAAPGNIIVVYLTSASTDTVEAFYETQLPTNGWTVISSSMGMIAAEKAGRGTTIVTIAASEENSGYTEISIIFSLE
ncbi:MAG: hypothetical protein ABIH20_01840 [Candidatus Diapherotrites archaeon]